MLKFSVWRITLLPVLVSGAVGGFFLAVFMAQANDLSALYWISAFLMALLAGALAALFSARMTNRKVEVQMIALADSMAHLRKKDKNGRILFPKPFLPAQARLEENASALLERAERAHSERERADAMLDNMNEGLVAVDSELTIVMLNRRAGQFFQADEAAMRGQNLLHLTHMPRLIEAATKTVQTGEAGRFDWQDQESGRTFQFSVSAVEGFYSRSGGHGAVLLITDVTAVRRTEQIRSEFVANASHELKTPLTAIKGFVELIEADIITNPEQVKGYLARIHAETERMIGLINDILRLSELESVNADAGFSTVSMKLTAQRAAESVAFSARAKEVSIRVEGDMGTLRANPDRMMQLALNLIDNAVKYNRRGGAVTVTVTTKRDGVAFCVRDTGIPPEAKERVFERFYRVDKGRSRRQGGTGLGLSIVKHIVGLYKGRIEVESEVGKGTLITVTLPVHLEDQEGK